MARTARAVRKDRPDLDEPTVVSALGQFAGPPIVAFVASAVGGWQWTWAVTGGASLIGLVFTWLLGRLIRRTAGAR